MRITPLIMMLVTLLFANSALATGGTSCQVDDSKLNLKVELTNGHIFGNPLVANSSIELTFKRRTVSGFSTYTFEKGLNVDEIPYWFNLHDELKLGAYAEPAEYPNGNQVNGFVTLSVVIEAKWFADESEEYDGHYVGTYTVIESRYLSNVGQKEQKIQGYITCFTE
jgi:hypothetical protein